MDVNDYTHLNWTPVMLVKCIRHPFGDTSPGLTVKRLYLAEYSDGILRADWTLPAEERFYPLVQLIGWKPKRDVPFTLPVKYRHRGDKRIMSLLPSGTWVLPYDDEQYQLYERAWTTINSLLERVETAPTDPQTLRLLTRWIA